MSSTVISSFKDLDLSVLENMNATLCLMEQQGRTLHLAAVEQGWDMKEWSQTPECVEAVESICAARKAFQRMVCNTIPAFMRRDSMQLLDMMDHFDRGVEFFIYDI